MHYYVSVYVNMLYVLNYFVAHLLAPMYVSECVFISVSEDMLISMFLLLHVDAQIILPIRYCFGAYSRYMILRLYREYGTVTF